jgi:predicted nuclease of predicted toxin-antitoxin system
VYPLRFLLDENVPLSLRDVFERLGHGVKHLSLEPSHGRSDEEVVELAIKEDRMLVTQDLDFGRLFHLHRRGELGVIVLRLTRLTLAGMETRLWEFLKGTDLEARGWTRSLVVLQPHRFRVIKSAGP